MGRHAAHGPQSASNLSETVSLGSISKTPYWTASEVRYHHPPLDSPRGGRYDHMSDHRGGPVALTRDQRLTRGIRSGTRLPKQLLIVFEFRRDDWKMRRYNLREVRIQP